MMKKAVIALDFSEDSLKQIGALLLDYQVVFLKPEEKEAINHELLDANIAIVGVMPERDVLKANNNLNWLHCDWSGLEHLAQPWFFEKGIRLTSSSGRSAQVLAEHAFMFMLSLSYNTRQIMQAQSEHRWDRTILYDAASLAGKTIGILGLGNTGSAIARIARSFSMRVLGYVRTMPEDQLLCHRYFSGKEGLRRILAQSHYIVLALPLTNETWHLINSSTLNYIRPSAFLINMSRGAIIDEQALIKVLSSKSIAGAGLDTFEQEPLSADSPLWELENVMITPHATPADPQREMISLQIIIENINRYNRGEPLINEQSKNVFGEVL